MEMLAAKAAIGFIVGTLIGITGVGGGVLLLPILIFGLRVPAIVAVGSDALFNFFTKIPASLLHLRKGTVRRKVVLALALGSVPGSILGVSFLVHLRHLYGNGVNDFIKTLVGVLLLAIPILLLMQGRIEERVTNRPPTMKSFVGMSFIGLGAGLLVGMTAVGSGSIIMMLLLMFYSFPHKVFVGKEIVQGVMRTGVTGMLLFTRGNVDPRVVVSLGIGANPGGLVGSHLATRVPMLWLRRILCTLLLITGARMLWA